MKRFHYFMYGLLSGAVLILTSVVLVQNFQSVSVNEATAQQGGTSASSTSEVAMATGQTQQGNNILYMTVESPTREAKNLLVYSAERRSLSLIAARTLKFDRELEDGYFGLQGNRNLGRTYPPVAELKRVYKQIQEQEGN